MLLIFKTSNFSTKINVPLTEPVSMSGHLHKILLLLIVRVFFIYNIYITIFYITIFILQYFITII